MPQALLLDLDGTLADTLADIASAMDSVLTSLGLRARTRDEYRRFVGDGAAALVRRALPADRSDLAEPALAGFRSRYGEHLLESTRPYDGIVEALAELHRRGVPLAILSNKPHDLTVAMVHRLFSSVPFRAVVGQMPGTPLKPDPTAALGIARTLGIAPPDWALVGDGPADMQAALRAGMLPVGVSWGFRDRAELSAAGAARVLDRPEELLELGT